MRFLTNEALTHVRLHPKTQSNLEEKTDNHPFKFSSVIHIGIKEIGSLTCKFI